MNKQYWSNERGAVLIIELIVLAIVIALAGIAAFRYVEHKKAANTAVSPVPRTPATTPDPYAGWLGYESAKDGISFRYPSDWELQGVANPRDDSDGWYQQTSLSKTSSIAGKPGGLEHPKFILSFRALKNPGTGFDTNNCSNVREVDTVQVPNHKAATIVAYGASNKVGYLGLTDAPPTIVGEAAGCGALLASKAGPGKYVDFHGYYAFYAGDSIAPMFNYDEFIAMPEVQTAQKILRSAAY